VEDGEVVQVALDKKMVLETEEEEILEPSLEEGDVVSRRRGYVCDDAFQCYHFKTTLTGPVAALDFVCRKDLEEYAIIDSLRLFPDADSAAEYARVVYHEDHGHVDERDCIMHPDHEHHGLLLRQNDGAVEKCDEYMKRCLLRDGHFSSEDTSCYLPESNYWSVLRFSIPS